MQHPIRGLHHVTATVSDAQEDLDFAIGMLGLRLIKQTVNFDNHSVYHFYYGNESGTPGSVWTTFPYKGHGVPVGEKGLGQITVTSFSVPASAIGTWRRHFESKGVSVRDQLPRFGEESILVTDPSGLAMEIVATDTDRRAPWTGNGLPSDMAIRGLHSVTLTSRAPELTRKLMIAVLGCSEVSETENRVRMGVGNAEPGGLVDIVDSPAAPPARNGLGTVHHVAFAVDGEEEQLRLRTELIDYGLKVTDVLDRCYFRSIYFREPGGILFEVATIKPGFTIDEELSALGTSLKLPPWEEPNRLQIEASLPPVRPA
jgi:glyoxalase family protein